MACAHSRCSLATLIEDWRLLLRSQQAEAREEVEADLHVGRGGDGGNGGGGGGGDGDGGGGGGSPPSGSIRRIIFVSSYVTLFLKMQHFLRNSICFASRVENLQKKIVLHAAKIRLLPLFSIANFKAFFPSLFPSLAA